MIPQTYERPLGNPFELAMPVPMAESRRGDAETMRPGETAPGFQPLSMNPFFTPKPSAPPGSFWDPRTGSNVVGIDTQRGKENYFKARGGNTASMNAVQGGQVFAGTGGSFGMGPMGEADPFNPRSKFDASKGKYTFAEGGEVDGPGGPKDDMIPAMLSDGEYVFPEEAVRFFGLDKLNKMKEKAKEEMMGMKMDMPKGGKGMMPHLAAGGPVNFGQYLGEKANEIGGGLGQMLGDFGSAVTAPVRMVGNAAMGLADAGGQFFGDIKEGFSPTIPQPQGRAAVPIPAVSQMPTDYSGAWAANQPAPATFGGPLANINPPARAFMPTAPLNPDPVPPMVAPQMLTGQVPVFNSPGMIPPPVTAPTIEDMKFQGLAARAALDSAKMDAAPSLNDGHFLAPWEKDAQARAARDAAAGFIPGVSKTAQKRFNNSAQGIASVKAERAMQAETKQQAERNRVKDEQWAAEFGLKVEEFQKQKADIERAAKAGDVNAQIALGRLNLDLSQFQAEQAKKGQKPAIEAVETPDKRGVAYFNQATGAPLSGVMPTRTGAPEVPAGMVPKSTIIDGTRYEVPTAKPEMIKIYNAAGEVKDWPADYELPDGGWTEAKRKGGAGAGGSGLGVGGNISKSDYDKLKSGQTYTWNGQTLTKK